MPKGYRSSAENFRPLPLDGGSSEGTGYLDGEDHWLFLKRPAPPTVEPPIARRRLAVGKRGAQEPPNGISKTGMSEGDETDSDEAISAPTPPVLLRLLKRS